MRVHVRSRHRGTNLRKHLAEDLPSYASGYLDAALAGNVEAAWSLSVTAPNAFRPAIVGCAWDLQIPRAALRVLVANIWGHDHDALLAYLGDSPELVRQIFTDCAFDVSALPAGDPVAIYRGVTGCGVTDAAAGLAWTLDQGVASFFACGYRLRKPGAPLVVCAAVRRSEIVWYSTARREAEVITRSPIGGASQWASEDTWRTAEEQWSAAPPRPA